jgi:hypothetical protein
VDNNETDSKTLYHYTDAAGLIGILKPSSWDIGDWPEFEKQLAGAAQFHASDVRYMNDSQELKFGARFFVTRLVEAATDPTLSNNARQACVGLATFFSQDDVFDWHLGCFATCFCEKGDLLSQWRGYAGGTGGFAIGISRDALAHRTSAIFRRPAPDGRVDGANTDLRPVKYGTAEAQAAANRFIDEMRDPGELMALMLGARDLEWLASYALRQMLSVKDEGFHEELEWRLYFLASDPRYYEAKIRLGRPGLVPYVHIAANMKKPDEETIPPAIERLVVGPGHNQPSQIAAARELLKACGHNPDVVVPSKISFTG